MTRGLHRGINRIGPYSKRLGRPRDRVKGRCRVVGANSWHRPVLVGSSGSENVSPEGLLERGRVEEGKGQRVSKTDGEGPCKRTDTVKI